ncbi:glycoside hydrolase family 3 protein [Mycobacterium manitobense]|uniref:beta-N-acetylhexosaminidase n=1 Tax=[Mycobacterium] manitobense TaxID=190147 RepID=A0A9X3BT65_9MYCO|nr:glycoside hydrolase family 3 N-terminal domain-containing protein [[Mycobacterium] manitobense]MCV7169293.1 glycoside hydrolase family 3 protein [[Mycobacterium] manitobense]
MVLSRVSALAAMAGLLLACAPAGEQPVSTPQPSPVNSVVPQAAPNVPLKGPLPAAPAAPACGDVLAGMSTRDKLAQLLMVGVTGAADARAVVDAHHVGGIMIGSWTDLSIMGDQLRDISGAAGPLPLAVSVDEEGGRVSRLAGLIGSQPSPRELAASQSPEQVYGIALDRGRKMRGLGITIDFAPVVDVTEDADNTVIGDRSFGADPITVTDYAGAYARGLRDAGVLPVLKHFPGHGHGSGDSHTGSVTTPPLADLQANDLVPYRTLTTQAPVAVMVGHMQVPGLTGSDPASLSPAAYALLRSGEYGGPPFGGPVFTDDLSSMQAITDRFGVAEAVLRSLQAGADTALWVSTGEVPAVLDRLEKALAAGELTPAAVDASVLRMAAAKGPNPRC